MSQVFSADSVNGPTSVTMTTTSETPGAVSNFVNPPFGTCKAIVFANVLLTTGASTTGVTLRIRRNPNAENAVISGTGPLVTVAATGYMFSFQAADVVPDGRPVQYQISAQQAGATGNGTLLQSNIAVILISG